MEGGTILMSGSRGGNPLTEITGKSEAASAPMGPCGKYLTTSQVAKRWGVSAVTVIRLIEQGDLKGLKIRSSYRISHGSVREYESRVAF